VQRAGTLFLRKHTIPKKAEDSMGGGLNPITLWVRQCVEHEVDGWLYYKQCRSNVASLVHLTTELAKSYKHKRTTQTKSNYGLKTPKGNNNRTKSEIRAWCFDQQKTSFGGHNICMGLFRPTSKL